MKTKMNPIALNLPSVVALLIVYGRHVVLKMTKNTWFPTPEPDLQTFTEHLDVLEQAEARALNGGKGAASARDDAQKVVMDDMTALKFCVAKVVSQNPGQAKAIIESAGMSPKGYTKPSKAALRAVLGPVPGVILVMAKAVKGIVAYEWQHSTDGGTTWITMPVTTVANTSLANVTEGTTYTFRFRTTRKNVTTDWSPTVSLTVH